MYDQCTEEERTAAADGCVERVRTILQARIHQLEEQRDAINDHYAKSDLFLRQFEIDFEEKLIGNLDDCLTCCAAESKAALSCDALPES